MSSIFKDTVTLNGRDISWNAAVNLMDDEIREDLSSKFNWYSFSNPNQRFLKVYCEKHLAKFGEEFEVA